MTTTDYFIQESLVLDWVWERVKVDRIIDKNIQILDTIPKCWMAWVISAIWPTIFIIGNTLTYQHIHYGGLCRSVRSKLLHWNWHPPRGESPTGQVQQAGSQ